MFILILFIVVGGVSGYRPCFTNFFLILFPLGAFFVIFNCIAIFRFRWKRGYFAFLPLFMSLLSFLSVNFVDDIGREVRIKVFKNNLNLYQQAVNELTPMVDEKGLSLEPDQVPQKLSVWLTGFMQRRMTALYSFLSGILDSLVIIGGLPIVQMAFYRRKGRISDRNGCFAKE
jgi:hypothetical protein